MTTMTGFGALKTLPVERITDKISRRVLSGKHGMIVWAERQGGLPRRGAPASQRAAGVDAQGPHGAAYRQRAARNARRRRGGDPGRDRARGLVSRRHRGGGRVQPAAGGFPQGRHARLHGGRPAPRAYR